MNWPNPPPRRPHNDRRHLPRRPAGRRPVADMGALRPVRRMGLRLDRAGVRGGADMKIEAGKYYRTRSGDVVGPIRHGEPGSHFPWITLTRCWTIGGMVFLGREGGENCMDLISEVYVSDTPPETAPAPEAKTLRDEFAMRLMDRDAFAVGYKDEAEQLYRAADAMMEARKK